MAYGIAEGAASAEDESRRFDGVEDLHTVLDTVPDAMILIKAGGEIILFNKGAEQMFGYDEAELLGENIAVLMPSPDREAHDGYISRYLETGERHIIGIGRIATARRRNGNTFPVELSVGETVWQGERAFAGFVRDLTQRRETEQQLHTLQEELSHVTRITSMGSLATAIAHEINQPLTAVSNYAQAALDLLLESREAGNELLQEALTECAAQALRAGDILHHLREFVSESERRREFTSLHKLIQDAAMLALLPGNNGKVEVINRLDPECDTVLVDPVQIQQVLVNLMRNSLEAMDADTLPQIELSSGPTENGMVRLCLADNGPGLPDSVRENLFNPFNSTKESGMGLGLSICQTIIHAHGGRIWLGQSDLGGTAICFDLPGGDLQEGSDQ